MATTSSPPAWSTTRTSCPGMRCATTSCRSSGGAWSCGSRASIALTGELDLAHLESLIDSRTKLVCCTGASNFLGTKNPLDAIRALTDASGYRAAERRAALVPADRRRAARAGQLHRLSGARCRLPGRSRSTRCWRRSASARWSPGSQLLRGVAAVPLRRRHGRRRAGVRRTASPTTRCPGSMRPAHRTSSARSFRRRPCACCSTWRSRRRRPATSATIGRSSATRSSARWAASPNGTGCSRRERSSGSARSRA